MSLRLFKRGKTWYVRGTVAGQSVYETTGTADRQRAEAFKARREGEIWDRRIHGERATVSFAEAALSYLEHRAPGPHDRAYIKRLLDHFCPGWEAAPNEGSWTRLADIDQTAVDRAVNAIAGSSAAPSTKVRNVITPITAIMNHGARRNWCDKPAFERPKQPKGRTRWLTPDEAQDLLMNCADHLRPIVLFMLCTGARVSEALYLDWANVDLAAAKAVFRDTKNGADRAAALPSAAVAALASIKHRKGPVFLKKDGTPYEDRGKEGGGQIKTGFSAACRRAGLGEWQDHDTKKNKDGEPARVFKPNLSPHDLRHTWASYFYAITRDPMLLRDEGGWKSIALVERYAHLMPSAMIHGIHTIWGHAHPTIGTLPTRAKSVHTSSETA